MRKITLSEAFGLRPARRAAQHARRALLGQSNEPPARWGLSSVRIFKPQISFPTWLGRKRSDGLTPVYNLFNRSPAPLDEGYSVRVTHARDFQGGQFTYDGHLGTDFACPVGTRLVAAAPAKVIHIGFEFDRGGLKLVLDHGQGLITTYAHCSRALVEVGDVVKRGQPIALSGAAGMDIFLFFPWVAPHVHFNTWLNGVPVDPFVGDDDDESSLWRQNNRPLPHNHEPVDEDTAFTPSVFDEEAVEQAIAACRAADWREEFTRLEPLSRRAGALLLALNYRAAMFDERPNVFAEAGRRRPILDLPFSRTDYVGAALP